MSSSIAATIGPNSSRRRRWERLPREGRPSAVAQGAAARGPERKLLAGVAAGNLRPARAITTRWPSSDLWEIMIGYATSITKNRCDSPWVERQSFSCGRHTYCAPCYFCNGCHWLCQCLRRIVGRRQHWQSQWHLFRHQYSAACRGVARQAAFQREGPSTRREAVCRRPGIQFYRRTPDGGQAPCRAGIDRRVGPGRCRSVPHCRAEAAIQRGLQRLGRIAQGPDGRWQGDQSNWVAFNAFAMIAFMLNGNFPEPETALWPMPDPRWTRC